MRIHYLDQHPNHFLVSSTAESRVPVAANIPTLYALEDHVPAEDLTREGATLIIGERNMATPLGLECLKHCVYLNTIYHSYPRISSKAPPLDGSIKPEDFEHHLNSMRNLPLFGELNHVAVLAKAASESPALIIQPGPSFDPAFIKAMADRCVTIAIGRTLPGLLEHGIVPDIVYQQDTSRNSWDVCFRMLKGRRLNSVLVTNPVGHIWDYFPCFAKIYKSWNYFPFEADRFPHVLDSIAPSTTTGALSLALHLGCNPVVLHGGDFGAPVPDGSPAARLGVSYFGQIEEDGLLVFKPLPHLHHAILLHQPDGSGIRTSADYLSASQWIKRKALSLGETRPEVKLYDHSSTGMLCVSSVIEPFRPEALGGRSRRLEIRGYNAPFTWTDFARELARRYATIRRIIAQSGRTPESSLTNPYNSLYTGMAQFGAGPFDLTPEQKTLALARADEVIATLQGILATAPGD
ncbi:MAG: 6-hydroxymethylpterin diphosphokinase MptE-like protein [Thermodesulfobacteriota bacterium]